MSKWFKRLLAVVLTAGLLLPAAGGVLSVYAMNDYHYVNWYDFSGYNLSVVHARNSYYHSYTGYIDLSRTANGVSGYTFVGWTEFAGSPPSIEIRPGERKRYYDPDKTRPSALFALYSSEARLTYSAPGAVSAPADQTGNHYREAFYGDYSWGTTVKLSENVVKANGARVEYWRIGSTNYLPGEIYTFTSTYVTATAIWGPPYTVTVNGGTGGGDFDTGAAVTITADPAPAGQRFRQWSISPAVTYTSGSDRFASTATFTMPAGAVTATAVYDTIPTYAVTVNNGTGSGNYEAGASVTISAAPAPSGQRFKQWNISPSVTFTSGGFTTPTATFTMPAGAVTAKAEYEVVTYAVTVNSGTGSGNYAEDAPVTITANAPPSGQRFKQWDISPSVTFTSGGLTTPTATFTMPAGAVTATAVYERITYTVTVNNGTGGGNYGPGDNVTITTDPPARQRFVKWNISPTVTFTSDGLTTPTATFTMPAGAVTATAVYEVIAYEATVISGTGSGSYAEDAPVTITANAPSMYYRFKQWNISPSVTFTNGGLTTPTATFTMPAEGVTATAVYERTAYTLTIINGTTYTGNYTEREVTEATTIMITANAPPSGQRFKQWVFSPAGYYYGDERKPTTTIVMPGEAATATAIYEDIPIGTVTVYSGTGSGSYAMGAAVPISADPASTCQQFKQWNISPTVTFTSGGLTTPAATFTMPAGAVTAVAEYAFIHTPVTVTTPPTCTAGGESHDECSVCGANLNNSFFIPATGHSFGVWIVVTPATYELEGQQKRTCSECGYVETAAIPKLDPITYAVNVDSGTGSGNYEAGVSVTISAAPAPSGQQFTRWNISPSVTFTSGGLTTPTATFTMPAQSVMVTPIYEATAYAVTVIGGTGSGDYAEGEWVMIEANAPPYGQGFKQWNISPSVVFAHGDLTSGRAYFIMPAGAVTVTAIYEAQTYAVTVDGGTGSGNHEVGSIVTITADPAPSGMQFSGWYFRPRMETFVESTTIHSVTAKFVMPDDIIYVLAIYEDIPPTAYTVTVNNGTGGGDFDTWSAVTIIADPAPAGQRFKEWNITPSVAFAEGYNTISTTAIFWMPAQAVTATAVYEANLPIIYTVTVDNGIGSIAGDVVTIIAAPAPKGEQFKQWVISPSVTFISGGLTTPTATFTMPADAVSAIAEYEPIPQPPTPTVKYIFSTKYEATIWNWIMFFLLFGWIWMWF